MMNWIDVFQLEQVENIINTWSNKVEGDDANEKEIRHLIKRLIEMIIMNRHIIA